MYHGVTIVIFVVVEQSKASLHSCCVVDAENQKHGLQWQRFARKHTVDFDGENSTVAIVR
jgi:hypothetical protein